MKSGAGHAIPHFPSEGLQFLRSLKRNNKRDWFQERKQTYEEFVRAPMEAIVEALAPELERFAPDIAASTKLSLFRIYRDTRFSKDKSPYKTHVAASFPPTGMAKHQGAGFYFHIAPTEFFIGGGPAAYRRAVSAVRIDYHFATIPKSVRRYHWSAIDAGSSGLPEGSSCRSLSEIQTIPGDPFASSIRGDDRFIRIYSPGHVPNALSFHKFPE